MGSHRVGHDGRDLAVAAAAKDTEYAGSIPRSAKSPGAEGKWQLTPVFLPENFHGQRSLMDFRPKVPIQLSTKSCQILGKKILSVYSHLRDRKRGRVGTVGRVLKG